MDYLSKKYGQIVPDFQRHVDCILEKHMPEQAVAVREILDRSLKKKQTDLQRLYGLLLKGLMTAEEFLTLLKAIKSLVSSRDIKSTGVSPEKAGAISSMITKLFRAMMVCRSGSPFANSIISTNSKL